MLTQELFEHPETRNDMPKVDAILDRIPKSFSRESGGSSKFFSAGSILSNEEDQNPLPVSPELSIWNNNNNYNNNYLVPISHTSNTTQDIDNTMTSARPLDSFLPTNLFNMDQTTGSDPPNTQQQSHHNLDPSLWNSFSTPNWSYGQTPHSNESSPTTNDLQYHIGQRTIVDNHKRQLSDMSMNSMLSFGSKFEDWASYLPTTSPPLNPPPSQQVHSSLWDQRASFSSNGSGNNSVLNDTSVSNGKGFFQDQVVDTSGFAVINGNADYVFGEVPVTQYVVPMIPEQVNDYFGYPNPDKLAVLKSLQYFRRSLGDNLPGFNIPDYELEQYQFCLVCFKNTRLDLFNISKEHRGKFTVGDLVSVQADRGVDLGRIVRMGVTLEEARLFKTKQNSDQRANCGKTIEELRLAGLEFPRGVLGISKPEEFRFFKGKEEDERAATKMCQEKVIEYGLNLMVDGCEYQWDKNKLTFYYQSDQRVDFRDLIRELFRIYKARIWMCKEVSLYTGR